MGMASFVPTSSNYDTIQGRRKVVRMIRRTFGVSITSVSSSILINVSVTSHFWVYGRETGNFDLHHNYDNDSVVNVSCGKSVFLKHNSILLRAYSIYKHELTFSTAFDLSNCVVARITFSDLSIDPKSRNAVHIPSGSIDHLHI